MATQTANSQPTSSPVTDTLTGQTYASQADLMAARAQTAIQGTPVYHAGENYYYYNAQGQAVPVPTTRIINLAQRPFGSNLPIVQKSAVEEHLEPTQEMVTGAGQTVQDIWSASNQPEIQPPYSKEGWIHSQFGKLPSYVTEQIGTALKTPSPVTTLFSNGQVNAKQLAQDISQSVQQQQEIERTGDWSTLAKTTGQLYSGYGSQISDIYTMQTKPDLTGKYYILNFPVINPELTAQARTRIGQQQIESSSWFGQNVSPMLNVDILGKTASSFVDVTLSSKNISKGFESAKETFKSERSTLGYSIWEQKNIEKLPDWQVALKVGLKSIAIPMAEVYIGGELFGWGTGLLERSALEGSNIAAALTSSIAKKAVTTFFAMSIGEQAYSIATSTESIGTKVVESAGFIGSVYLGYEGFKAGYGKGTTEFFTPKSIEEIRPTRPQMVTTKEGGIVVKNYLVELGETEKVKLTAKVPVEEIFKIQLLGPDITIIEGKPKFITDITKNIRYETNIGLDGRIYGRAVPIFTGKPSSETYIGTKIEVKPLMTQRDLYQTIIHEQIHAEEMNLYWQTGVKIGLTQEEILKDLFTIKLRETSKGETPDFTSFEQIEKAARKSLKGNYSPRDYRMEYLARFGAGRPNEILQPTTQTGLKLNRLLDVTSPEIDLNILQRDIMFPKQFIRTSTIIAEPKITAQYYNFDNFLGIKYLGETKTIPSTPQMMESFGKFWASKDVNMPPTNLVLESGEGYSVSKTISNIKATVGEGYISVTKGGEPNAMTFFPKLTTFANLEGKGVTIAEDIFILFKQQKNIIPIKTAYEETFFRPIKEQLLPKTPTIYEAPKTDYFKGVRTFFKPEVPLVRELKPIPEARRYPTPDYTKFPYAPKTDFASSFKEEIQGILGSKKGQFALAPFSTTQVESLIELPKVNIITTEPKITAIQKELVSTLSYGEKMEERQFIFSGLSLQMQTMPQMVTRTMPKITTEYIRATATDTMLKTSEDTFFLPKVAMQQAVETTTRTITKTSTQPLIETQITPTTFKPTFSSSTPPPIIPPFGGIMQLQPGKQKGPKLGTQKGKGFLPSPVAIFEGIVGPQRTQGFFSGMELRKIPGPAPKAPKVQDTYLKTQPVKKGKLKPFKWF